jgi:hypothetical protein
MLTAGSEGKATMGLGRFDGAIWSVGLNMVELGEFMVELREMWLIWLWCFGRELEMTLGFVGGVGRVPLSIKSCIA